MAELDDLQAQYNELFGKVDTYDKYRELMEHVTRIELSIQRVREIVGTHILEAWRDERCGS